MLTQKENLKAMFDFHTHILPGIDDGSRSISESLAMLDELIHQGVSGIAATPHFYAQRTSPAHFFTQRENAWARLKPRLRPNTPEIRLGAEILYFEGIHRFAELEKFCLEGTGLLLIEMPMCTWTTRMASTILEVNSLENITVMLAHIDRYLRYRNQKILEQFLQHGILTQANTSFFVEKRHAAMKMLREGKIHFLGTDSHNMVSRPPNFAPALRIISHRKGEQWILDMEQREEIMLHETKNDVDNFRDSSAGDRFVTIC